MELRGGHFNDWYTSLLNVKYWILNAHLKFCFLKDHPVISKSASGIQVGLDKY